MESLRISQRRRCLERKPTTRTQQTSSGTHIGIIGSHQEPVPTIIPLNSSLFSDGNANLNIAILGGPSTYTVIFPDNKPSQNTNPADYYCGTYPVNGISIILSLILPAIEDPFPSQWRIGYRNSRSLVTGFGKVSEGVYQFSTTNRMFGENITYTYSAGQTLTIYMSNGFQKLSLDGVELATASLTLNTIDGYSFFISLFYSDALATGPIIWIMSFATEAFVVVPTTPIEFQTIDFYSEYDITLTIFGGPTNYTIIFPSTPPTVNGNPTQPYFCVAPDISGNAIIASYILPPIEDSYPANWEIGIFGPVLAHGFGKVSDGIYAFNTTDTIFNNNEFMYTAGQTLTIILANGIQILSLDGVELTRAANSFDPTAGFTFYIVGFYESPQIAPVTWNWSFQQGQVEPSSGFITVYDYGPISNLTTQFVGNFGTCIKKIPDKPNVSESQRIALSSQVATKQVLDSYTPIFANTNTLVLNDYGEADLPTQITGGPYTYTITYPNNIPTDLNGGYPYYVIVSDVINSPTFTFSFTLPAVSDPFPTNIVVVELIVGVEFAGFGQISPGLYQFACANGIFFIDKTFTYKAGQTLTCFLQDGFQTLSLDGNRIASDNQAIDTTEWELLFLVGNYDAGGEGPPGVTTPISFTVNVSEPQFIPNFKTVLCSSAGIQNRTSNGKRVYTTVGTTQASATTLMLKDNITAAAPRFSEFITPRPPPNYYFFGSTNQISMAGDSKAPNHVCGPGEIKRVA